MKKILSLFAAIFVAVSMSATDIVWTWTSADASLSCSDGSSHEFTSEDGNYTLTFKAGGSKDKVDATSSTIDDVTYTHQLYMNGATNSNKRYVSFTGISGDGYLTIVTGTNAGGKPVLSTQSNTTASNVIATITNETGGPVAAKGSYTSELIEDLDAESTYYVCFPTKCYLYAVIWTPYTGSPVTSMSVSPAQIIDVPATGDNFTIEYSISNPIVGAEVSASADVTWINSFDYSVDGEVSFAVDANSGAAREGIVTLSYNEGAVEKRIRVAQKRYFDRSVVYSVNNINMEAYQDDATSNWEIESDWSSSTITSATAYYKLFASNSLNSPTTNLENINKIKIIVNMRTVGGVSGNSAKLDIKYGTTTLGTLTATTNSLADYEITLDELPVGNNYFTFESQSTDATHGVGVRNITILILGEDVPFTAGQMKTYSSAVPFHVDGAKVYKAAAEADAIALTEITSGDVPAGVGVILYSETAADATISEIASAAAVTNNDLLATTTATTPLVEKPAGEVYVLGNDNLFHPYSGAAFAANRAYLLRPAGAEGPVRVIFLEDEVTAVENVEATETVKFMENGQLFIKKNGVIYNAMGQVVK